MTAKELEQKKEKLIGQIAYLKSDEQSLKKNHKVEIIDFSVGKTYGFEFVYIKSLSNTTKVLTKFNNLKFICHISI